MSRPCARYCRENREQRTENSRLWRCGRVPHCMNAVLSFCCDLTRGSAQCIVGGAFWRLLAPSGAPARIASGHTFRPPGGCP